MLSLGFVPTTESESLSGGFAFGFRGLRVLQEGLLARATIIHGCPLRAAVLPEFMAGVKVLDLRFRTTRFFGPGAVKATIMRGL